MKHTITTVSMFFNIAYANECVCVIAHAHENEVANCTKEEERAFATLFEKETEQLLQMGKMSCREFETNEQATLDFTSEAQEKLLLLAETDISAVSMHANNTVTVEYTATANAHTLSKRVAAMLNKQLVLTENMITNDCISVATFAY